MISSENLLASQNSYWLFKEWAESLIRSSGVDLKTVFPKEERSDDYIMKIAREKVFFILFVCD